MYEVPKLTCRHVTKVIYMDTTHTHSFVITNILINFLKINNYEFAELFRKSKK